MMILVVDDAELPRRHTVDLVVCVNDEAVITDLFQRSRQIAWCMTDLEGDFEI